MTPPSKDLQGCKKAKEDIRMCEESKNNNIIPQAPTIAYMAITTLERIAIILNQNMITYFSMLDNLLTNAWGVRLFQFPQARGISSISNLLQTQTQQYTNQHSDTSNRWSNRKLHTYFKQFDNHISIVRSKQSKSHKFCRLHNIASELKKMPYTTICKICVK